MNIKNSIKYSSHLILQSKFKWIFTIIPLSAVYFFISTHIAENMGNCCGLPIDSTEMLDSRHYLSQQGIQAENRALNTIITDLRQEILDLKHQIIVNNQMSEEQTTLIQQLTTEQKETKVLILELKQEIAISREKNNAVQEKNFHCMR